ncbi:MAG TPA: (2Fe-2S) ferredoxin domain-containing protein [Candidatus Hydrogenedentes bacterium]|nr:(2Fe-2S) ferredoxin domain-containing protein [Candidatus Hydrogenedentota bacterium]
MSKRITNPEDLRVLREKAKADVELRAGLKETQITVHMGTCGIAAGAREVLSAVADELAKASLDTVSLRQSGCLGLCDREPMLTVADKDGNEFRYGKLDAKKARMIVQEHLLSGNPVVSFLVSA